MRRLLLTTLLTTACAAAPLAAAGFGTAAPSGLHGFAPSGPETLWLAKEHKADKEKGGKKEKKPKKDKKDTRADKGKKDKPEKAGKPEKAEKPNKGKSDARKAEKAKGKPDKTRTDKSDSADLDARVARIAEKRETVVERLMQTPAPAGRDMAAILGAAGLALAAPNLTAEELTDDSVVTYRNCPPGLAKKDPPCVPPGLAKKGVTYEEWARLSDAELDALLEERRREYLDAEPLTDAELLLLDSDQIATLFKLDPAPEGSRYALIDGQPVLLSEEDYTALRRINELARVAELGSGISVAPTAALTQAELMRLYRLPEPEDGYSYAVLNGQVIALQDSAYEVLQLIRVARAVL